MGIRVTADYFGSADGALEEINRLGLHPVEMDVPPVSNTSHWHHFSTRIYILSGELKITDVAASETLRAGPGTLVEVPENTLHAEHSESGYRIVAGMTVDPATLTGPVDLPPESLPDS